MTAMLRATDLAVGYSGKRSATVVLEHLNLNATAGELICLLGPNGIGKSTLLRTLSRVQPGLAGLIEIESIPLDRMSRMEFARRVGVVLTERPLVGALPAYRLVELGRYPHVNWLGQLSEHDQEVVEWAIEAVSARHLAGRDSNKLSDGERQRFMIARALAQEPSLLLLDEPTAFLDVAARAELMGLLRRLAREQGIAIIASTHDLEQALRVADTVWLIGPDRRLQAAAPEDMILARRLEQAFPADTIRFDPMNRTFRPVSEAKGRAVVRGEGLAATLAAAALEREGVEVIATGPADLQVHVDADGRWDATRNEAREAGENFASLARFARNTAANRVSDKIGR